MERDKPSCMNCRFWMNNSGCEGFCVRHAPSPAVITLPGDMPEYMGVKPGDYVMLSVGAPDPNGFRTVRIEKADTMETR